MIRLRYPDNTPTVVHGGEAAHCSSSVLAKRIDLALTLVEQLTELELTILAGSVEAREAVKAYGHGKAFAHRFARRGAERAGGGVDVRSSKGGIASSPASAKGGEPC